MKIALRIPAAILGAASDQTRAVRGARDKLSGSTSPKMRISLRVCSSSIKNAALSVTQGSEWMNSLLLLLMLLLLLLLWGKDERRNPGDRGRLARDPRRSLKLGSWDMLPRWVCWRMQWP